MTEEESVLEDAILRNLSVTEEHIFNVLRWMKGGGEGLSGRGLPNKIRFFQIFSWMASKQGLRPVPGGALRVD